jgi:hypothetical protein
VDWLRRIACHYRISWYIFVHDRIGADYGIGTDVYTLQNNSIEADPGMIANHYGRHFHVCRNIRQAAVG